MQKTTDLDKGHTAFMGGLSKSNCGIDTSGKNNAYRKRKGICVFDIPSRLMRSWGAIRVYGLTWKYFGWRTATKYLLALPLAIRRDALVSAFEKVGPCKMSYGGTRLRWAVANPLFIWEIIEKECYTGRDGFHIRPGWTVIDEGANIGTFT
ncbi:MAG: hypothetical protein QXR69_03820, partial [Conexivisphaerales archaeon]